MKALLNLLAGFTMFMLISPPPALKVCVKVWYCGTISFKLCPSKKGFVILLSSVLSDRKRAYHMIVKFIRDKWDGFDIEEKCSAKNMTNIFKMG